MCRVFSRILFVVFVTLLSGVAIQAQYRAGIQGTVQDPNGGAVVGAKVTVLAQETGVSQETTTSDSGVYSVNRLAPGPYTVTVEAPGFKTKTTRDINIIGDQVSAVDVTLEVGEVTQSVTVNGSQLPAIDTESGQLSGTVTSQDIQALPSFGRDVYQLTQLAPGVFGDAAQASGGGSAHVARRESGRFGKLRRNFQDRECSANYCQWIATGSQQHHAGRRRNHQRDVGWRGGDHAD